MPVSRRDWTGESPYLQADFGENVRCVGDRTKLRRLCGIETCCKIRPNWSDQLRLAQMIYAAWQPTACRPTFS